MAAYLEIRIGRVMNGLTVYLSILSTASLGLFWFSKRYFVLKVLLMAFSGTLCAHIIEGIKGNLDTFIFFTFTIVFLYSLVTTASIGSMVYLYKRYVLKIPLPKRNTRKSNKYDMPDSSWGI